MVVAWRIYYLTKLGREVPDVPCTVFLKKRSGRRWLRIKLKSDSTVKSAKFKGSGSNGGKFRWFFRSQRGMVSQERKRSGLEYKDLMI